MNIFFKRAVRPTTHSFTVSGNYNRAYYLEHYYLQHAEPVIQRQWLMQEVRRVLLGHEQNANKWVETVKNCHPALRDLEVRF